MAYELEMAFFKIKSVSGSPTKLRIYFFKAPEGLSKVTAGAAFKCQIVRNSIDQVRFFSAKKVPDG